MEAEELKARRESTGMTQVDFALSIGARPRTYQYWEAHGIANEFTAKAIRDATPDYKEDV